MAYEYKHPVQTHYFYTKAWSGQGTYGDVLECLEWRDMQADHFMRWRWYFNYRAALLQVKYPRACVQTKWGTMTPSTKSELKILQNRLVAAKRKITEWKNKIKSAESKYDEIFPIEDHIVYKQAKSRLFNYRNRYFELKRDIQLAEEKLNKNG